MATGDRYGVGYSMEYFEDFNEDLIVWISALRDMLEEFSGTRPALEYSLESLELVDDYLLAVALDQTEPAYNIEGIRKCAGAYIGEVFRRRVGGEWVRATHPEAIPAIGTPVIDGWWPDAPHSYFSPFDLVQKTWNQLEKGVVRRAIEFNEELLAEWS